MNDLNEIHKLERGLVGNGWAMLYYCNALNDIVRADPKDDGPYYWALINATADQRSRALEASQEKLKRDGK